MSRFLTRARMPVAVLMVAVGLSGCAAILQSTRQDIVANSTPDAARVTTTPATGEYQTPITLRLERKRGYSLKFEKAGYSPATVNIQNHLQVGWLILDIVCGLIPVIVDAATGAWYGLTPSTALVAMTRVAQGDGPDVIYVGLSTSVKNGVRSVDVSAPVEGVSVQVQTRQ